MTCVQVNWVKSLESLWLVACLLVCLLSWWEVFPQRQTTTIRFIPTQTANIKLVSIPRYLFVCFAPERHSLNAPGLPKLTSKANHIGHAHPNLVLWRKPTRCFPPSLLGIASTTRFDFPSIQENWGGFYGFKLVIG